MTKKELTEWIENENNQGNAVPCVINGGGFGYITYDLTGWCSEFAHDDEYADEVEPIAKGEEYEDFRECLDADEYNAMQFVRVRHRNGYNEENFDYQFGIWSD